MSATRKPGERDTAPRASAARQPANVAAASRAATTRVRAQCACGGTCPRCRTPAAAPSAYAAREQDADRRAGAALAQSSPARDGAVASQSSASDSVTSAPATIQPTLAANSAPLTPSLQAFYGARYGHDFSAVRVHTDGSAARSAMALNALAYTFGSHIVFAPGQYRPDTPLGQRMLAHELAHVAQQREGAPAQVQRWPSWDEIRESMYSGLIDGLRSVQRGGLERLRTWSATLSPTQQTIANGIIAVVEAVSEILIELIFAVVGLLVGFGSGIVQMIVGLFQLAVGIMQGLLLFLYGFIDGGARFDEWAQHVLDGIANLPNALGTLITSWLHEFEIASTDRQIIMIGELTGQVLALIATFEFAAGRAGSLPRVAIAFGEGGAPRMALATVGGGMRALPAAGTAITVDVASPAAAVGMTGAMAMSVDASLESLLGEGPETDAMQDASRRRAGMASRPRHHIFPQEFRDFFRQRGFADIDDFCVELEEAEHQALHGGGNWRLGRTWPNEWNQRIMRELAEAEGYMGRPLTRAEIITIGRELMVEYGIDEAWVPYR